MRRVTQPHSHPSGMLREGCVATAPCDTSRRALRPRFAGRPYGMLRESERPDPWQHLPRVQASRSAPGPSWWDSWRSGAGMGDPIRFTPGTMWSQRTLRFAPALARSPRR
jgi:hypothetical protein